MATDANKRVLREVGLLSDEAAGAGANDLIVVIEAASHEAGQRALAQAEPLLAERARSQGATIAAAAPRTLEQARAQFEGANLMHLSVPGPYAALEAAKALHSGMHVFLFSDNVGHAQELALKRLAVAKGLLLMGPGCGTAIINGVGFGFANRLRRGAVGVVGASGTGLQELTSLIDRGGLGISQAIGVGGRDLSEPIGGLMMLQGIAMLAEDPQTRLIVLISKPPAPSVAPKILDAARTCGKPVIVNFLGSRLRGEQDGLLFCGTIQETAEAVLRMLQAGHAGFAREWAHPQELIARERALLRPGQRYLRGLFSGGSLCDEAMELLAAELGKIYSNIPLTPAFALPDAWRSQGHCCVDMGEEEFTRGRPHPMIDTRLRQERLIAEAEDSQVAVILLDVVIGYGAHDDPAAALSESIELARARAAAAGRHLSVVAHVCGTAQDPQNLEAQERRLREAGALVLPTNAQAARVAAAIVV
jgi:succinyl-CoA synthetase alpha subunit